MIRLLIADDEKLERDALTEMVARRFDEHQVVLETAENGRKAADTAILWGADLILMDIEMPGMSGLDAARAVLAQRPGCRVIFVTAYSLFQYAHEAVHLGACDYLLKPVDPDELEASIRRAIRQIETERKLETLAPVQPEPEPAAAAEGQPEADTPESSQNALVMDHVRRYLEDNYMFDISLDSVGEILHISPASLSAQFKKYQKMNFLDCLTELRINAAKELLNDPFRSSAEVASMVGYEDASYFARAFKKRTGVTPTQYRKQAAKAAKERPAHTGCPGAAMRRMQHKAPAAPVPSAEPEGQLTNWPVQIKLAPTKAPYFDNAALLVAADCSAFTYGDFHRRFLAGRVCLIGCPKLDGVDYTEKLTEIIRNNDVKSLTIVRMEVPCCGGLEFAAKTALQNSGKFIPWQVVTVNIDGTLREN